MIDSTFVGRTEELSYLQEAWDSNRFEFCVLYGRRRVGKTALVSRFCADKPHIFHMGQLGSEAVELSNLSQAVSRGVFESATVNFSSFEDVLRYLSEISKDERLIFVIDEFPYLAKSIVSAMSSLQHAIDHYLGRGKLMIILTGSSISFMEQEVLGHKSPLYGRRTRTLKLGPLSLGETALLCRRSAVESVLVHAMTGGIPLYVQYFSDPQQPLFDAIESVWFTKTGLLYQEPQFLLTMETRKGDQYMQLLSLLASGATKPNELATKLGISSAHIAALLSTLATLGIVEKRFPFSEQQQRKGVWTIIDPLFAFHLRFVYPYLAVLELGKRSGAMKVLSAQFDQFVGTRFELMCHRYFIEHTQREIIAIAHWWGPNAKPGRNEEIDLVAQDINGGMVFGECKWRNTPVGMGEYQKLKERSDLLPGGTEREFWLFSKSGFTEELRSAQKATLVELEEMVRER